MFLGVKIRFTGRGFVLVAILCVLSAASGPVAAQDEAASPWERAALYRDEWGTPHVYAEDPRSLAFVFGYAQAEDHLEAMLAAYRVANGRAAEVFGESYADSDEFSLKMGHAALAHDVYESLDPLTRDLCEGFAMGVNAWLVEHADQAPPWADGAKPQDILALLHCFLMSMAPFDLPEVYHRAPASVSGNAWAVAPSRSDSGETFLVINPHTNYSSPFQWYEAHLVCQDINVAGATLFGLPVILQGHNEVLGWALTPNQPDFADVYLEPSPATKPRPKFLNARRVLEEDKLIEIYLLANMRPYYVLTPEGPVERSTPCVDTPRGPLIGIHNGHLCMYLVGGYRDFGTIAQLVEMARARDLGSFQSALGMHQLPCFNVVYADREGNISYVYNTKVGNKLTAVLPPQPDKGKDGKNEEEDPSEGPPPAPPRFIDWTIPVPADDPYCAWGDIIPPGALPAATNPASGYVQACGSPPWLATDGANMRPDQFPAWFSHDPDTFRAQRVRRLLGTGKRSFRDCQSMLYDVVAPFAIDAVPRLLETAKQRADFVDNAHPDLPAGLDALRTWNFLADTNSPGMTFFHAWWTALSSRNIETYPSKEALMSALKVNDAEIQDLSLEAATEAARMMRNEFDSLSVPWGDVHTVMRGDRETPLCGATSGEPVFVASDEVFERRKWRVTYGYGFAMAVSFGEKPRAVSMVPFGASEDPKSPHYADQLDLMAQRRFKVARYGFEDVQRNAASARGQRLYLRPKGMEALFTLSAAAPIVARLTTATEAPEKLPEDLVPFTLFVTTEKVPRSRPASTHIDVFIPPVLCASEDLDKLAVYACDATRKWVRLDAQQLDPNARTFLADDNQGSSTYAVLGPSKYRATRLAIPDEHEPATPQTKIPTPGTRSGETPAQASEGVEAPANAILAPTDANQVSEAPRKFRVMWGVPPKRKAQQIVVPRPEDASAVEPPEMDVAPLQDSQAMPRRSDDEKRRAPVEEALQAPPTAPNVKRNFSFGTPPADTEPRTSKRDKRRTTNVP